MVNNSTTQLFKSIQANMLKGHGMNNAAFVLLTFDKIEYKKVRSLIGSIKLTSSWEQFQDSKNYSAWKDTVKADMEKGKLIDYSKAPKSQPIICFYLSYKGYQAIKKSNEWGREGHEPFMDGMSNRDLNDPPVNKWERSFQKEIHGMFMVAHDDLDLVNKKINEYRKKWDPYIQMAEVQYGQKLTNKFGKTIEHFGYVDGISQPYFKEVPNNKENKHSTNALWDPTASMDLVLADDPHQVISGEYNKGSFLVYRKLEQNVKAFKEAEKALAHKLGLSGEAEEIAGALIVGRFENGLPIVKFGSTVSPEEPSEENNFNYSLDPDGIRCPFHAHIRKTNPRGDSKRLFGISDKTEKNHRILRVGITYDDIRRNNDLEFHPERGVGLLFMCMQSMIENQFEFIQRSWANNNDFPQPYTGIDPVIGQGENRKKPNGEDVEQKWTDTDRKKIPASFSSFVTMKGGEYFFAPSLAFFKSLIETTA